MTKQQIHQMRTALRRGNQDYPNHMVSVPEENWPLERLPNLVNVWRSNKFLAQVHQEQPGCLRVSISRTMIDDKGRYLDGITWDEMMQIKREIGLGDTFAVEVFPMDQDIVNVFACRKGKPQEAPEITDEQMAQIANGEEVELDDHNPEG